ncbi:Arm DNA-binding domain-containing protein [Flavisphingomonas formosensis]|uniref:Arm DNA-binding domain-containing protein n=1 Tax=Flavisphingomonas formosensis TaxID=861534 RepID=UPI0012FBA92E|nr:Arm DNA-binding domain-containing protein [Sphingomonas formosensis]
MLTDISLRALQPKPTAYKKADGGGLFISVRPNGEKSWGLAVRVNGKQRFLSGGLS